MRERSPKDGFFKDMNPISIESNPVSIKSDSISIESLSGPPERNGKGSDYAHLIKPFLQIGICCPQVLRYHPGIR